MKPDIVTYSKSLDHSIVLDCKGGTSVNADQIQNYQRLGKEELNQFLRDKIYDFNQYSEDVCFVDFQRSHAELARHVQGFPFITIAPDCLRKSGAHFTREKLERLFASDIVIPADMREPSSYYPFSDNDSQGVVVKEVIRAFIVILGDRRMSGFDVFKRATYASPVVMKLIHPMFDVMGADHQRTLIGKIWDVVTYLQKEYSEECKQIFDIQNSRWEGVDIHIRLANLKDACQRILEQEEEKEGLERFLPEPTRRN